MVIVPMRREYDADSTVHGNLQLLEVFEWKNRAIAPARINYDPFPVADMSDDAFAEPRTKYGDFNFVRRWQDLGHWCV